MKGTIFRAMIIALVISVVLSVAVSILSGVSIEYKSGWNPEEYYSLSYDEQKKWTKENQIKITGINYLIEVFKNKFLFVEFIRATILIFLVILDRKSVV